MTRPIKRFPGPCRVVPPALWLALLTRPQLDRTWDASPVTSGGRQQRATDLGNALQIIEDVPVGELQILGAHESDRAALRVRAEHPGDVLHVPERRVLMMDIFAARDNLERDRCLELSTLDDLIAGTWALRDLRKPATVAKRRLVVTRGGSLNLDLHGLTIPPSRCVSSDLLSRTAGSPNGFNRRLQPPARAVRSVTLRG